MLYIFYLDYYLKLFKLLDILFYLQCTSTALLHNS